MDSIFFNFISIFQIKSLRGVLIVPMMLGIIGTPLFARQDTLAHQQSPGRKTIPVASVVVPLTVSLASMISGFDDVIKDYSQSQHPLFHNTSDANQISNQLRDFLKYQALGMMLLTPDSSGRYTFHNLGNRMLDFITGYAITINLTYLLKHSTSRMRPDHSDRFSFPSGHTSSAMFYAVYSGNQTEDLKKHSSVRNFIKIESFLLASACGWARIEANKHYFSDIMGSIAVVNFSIYLNEVLKRQLRRHFRWFIFVQSYQNKTQMSLLLNF